MRRIWAIVLVLCWGLVGFGREQTPSFTLSVQGSYTWSFALGIGDREPLRRAGLTPWVPWLRQGFTASVEGRALDVITVRAKLDSSRGVAFQDFGIYLDAARWKGVLGNFSLGDEYAFAVPRRTLLGTKLAYVGDGFTVEGVASRSLGKLETRLFRGERGHLEREFRLRDPKTPWAEVPYRVQLEGLYYFELAAPYVEGFSEAKLALEAGEDLWGLLDRYGLGYLREVLEEEPAREFDFTVIRDSGTDVLLLLNSPRENAKRWIEDAIRAYNDRHGLTGAAEKRYPFVRGSELEREFLDRFIGFVKISVNGEAHPLGAGKRRRYLDLGEKDVVPETLAVEIREPGATDYRPLGPEERASIRLFPEEGILRVDFPDRFFADDAALRVSFDYVTQRAVFVLSPLAGIVPNSERVYRNGQRLQRGQQYSIDYEGGILQLFKPLGEGEELRVEYEVPHGLGTGPQEDFLGVSLSLGKEAKLFLFRSAESVELTPATPTMPNDHTVAGVMLSGEGKGWNYSLLVGGSVNIFPPGKNERIPSPNRVTDIVAVAAPDGRYAVFSHYRGISAFKDGVFASYLEGRRVYDLLYVPAEEALLIAARGGVVIVDLSRSFPFDWRESYTELALSPEGFGGEEGGADRLGREALALAADPTWVYIATERGIIRFPVGDLRSLPGLISDEAAWRAWRERYWALWAEVPNGDERPTALLAREGALYMGTDAGLYLWAEGGWEAVRGVKGPVHALLYLPEDTPDYPAGLYAATATGISHVRDGILEEWVLSGPEILSLAFLGETLFYGTRTGLFGAKGGPLYGITVPVTALGRVGDTLWVGTEATSSEEGGPPGNLSLWAVDPAVGAVVEYPTAANRILPTDPNSYRDISPEGNTDRGLLVQFSWNERLKDGVLSWYVRASTPGFEPLDRPPPGDVHAVGFSLSREIESLSLKLTGSVGIQRLFSRPISDVRGGLSLTWSPGPRVTLSLSPRYKGLGTEEAVAEMGYDLGFSWKNPAQELSRGLLRQTSLRVRGGLRGGTGNSGGTAELRAVLGPCWGFTLDLSGRRPYLLGGEPTGRESLRGSVSGELSLFGLKGGFAWKETWTRELGPYVAGDWRYSREISFAPKLGTLVFGGWDLRPSLTLAWREDPSETRLFLKGTPSLGRSSGGDSGRATFGFELGYRRVHRTGDVAYSLSLTPRLTYTLPSVARVELNASLAYDLLLRQPRSDARSRLAIKRVSLTLVPRWWDGLEPTFVLTYSPGQVELSLQRTLLEFRGLSAEVTARLRWDLGSGDLEGEVKAVTASFPLAEDWRLNLEAGYLIRLRRGTELKQGLYLRGNLSLDFSL
ncbi:hypothetical protein ACVNPS_06220 [Candidatus Bipolaricaulota sp. J31]